MKFMCLGYIEDGRWGSLSESQQNALMEECWSYDDELLKNGHVAGGYALQSAADGATIRFREGKVLVTDGPYPETKEHIGGVLVLEANDMDQAVQLMLRHPGVRLGGPFEIRPIDEERLKLHPQAVVESHGSAKKFAFLGYNTDDNWHDLPQDQLQAKLDACHAFEEARRRNGQWHCGLGLQSAKTAKTVRFDGQKVIVTDGPFAETKEQLGGLIVLFATDKNQAIELMSEHGGLPFVGAIEVRPIDEAIVERWNARQAKLRERKESRSLAEARA